MRKVLILFLLTVFLQAANGCANTFSDDLQIKEQKLKEAHGFSNWPGKTKPPIDAVRFSKDQFPGLETAKEVRVSSSDTKVGSVSVKTTDYYWIFSKDDTLLVRVTRANSSSDAQELLIRRWASASASHSVKTPGAKYAMNLGDVCFAAQSGNHDRFIKIWFVRNNLMTEINASGKMQNLARGIAERIDDLFQKPKNGGHP